MKPSVMPGPGEVTDLLRKWQAGDREVEGRLFELVVPDLRRLAGHYMRGERAGHTLQPTALLNETYIKLVGSKHVQWRDRRHFFALAARAMRRFLIDYARSKGKEISLPPEEVAQLGVSDAGRLELAVSVDRLLDELAKENPEQCAMVELKFFLGLNDQEAADVLHLPLRTAQRRWMEARNWLFARLETQKWKEKRPRTTSAS
jgi:RNA polymerase sigma factor (TIGR02999 family)